MGLTIRLTGTGGAQLVPVFGCDCAACQRARSDEAHRRRPCSAVVTFNDAVTLLDAGLPDLMDRWPAGQFQQFLLTHYHMDHVQGLFPLRWGVGAPIPVFGPPDPEGCDDPFKHPGLLDFSHTVEPFVVFNTGIAGDAATAESLEADVWLSAGVGAQPGRLVVGYRRITGKDAQILTE